MQLKIDQKLLILYSKKPATLTRKPVRFMSLFEHLLFNHHKQGAAQMRDGMIRTHLNSTDEAPLGRSHTLLCEMH